MAALSCAAGYPLFGDDLLRLRIGDATTYAHRGSSEIRLRPAVTDLADLIPGEKRTTVDMRTSVRPLRSAEESLPVSVIVLPRPDRRREAVEARRLRSGEAFQALTECPRLVGWQTPEMLDREFDHLVALSSAVPVVETFVPWRTSLCPELAEEAIQAALAAASDQG